MAALLGFMSLSGMFIKNAIVLVDEIQVQQRAGSAVFKAIVDSGVSRLRPVAMAALTTALGMIPLLLLDAFFVAMAALLIGYLLAVGRSEPVGHDPRQLIEELLPRVLRKPRPKLVQQKTRRRRIRRRARGGAPWSASEMSPESDKLPVGMCMGSLLAHGCLPKCCDQLAAVGTSTLAATRH
jgi:hypothetical protein